MGPADPSLIRRYQLVGQGRAHEGYLPLYIQFLMYCAITGKFADLSATNAFTRCHVVVYKLICVIHLSALYVTGVSSKKLCNYETNYEFIYFQKILLNCILKSSPGLFDQIFKLYR